MDRFDYELNDKKPDEIQHGTRQSYYFKCPLGIHPSELKVINDITSECRTNKIICNKCSSFAQHGIDNIDAQFLEKYWDYKKNIGIDPWKISYGSTKDIYIKCQEYGYHESYNIRCNDFMIKGARCSYCSGHKVHPLDSLGYLYPQVFDIWSKKNKKSPYEYMPSSNQFVWWKCADNKHEDYFRSIANSSFLCDFRCPECQYSKGEKRIEDYLVANNFVKISQDDYVNMDIMDTQTQYYIPQKEYEGLLGTKRGLLSYDFYLCKLNLLIEYQGEFHDGTIKYKNETLKSAEDRFKNQQEHDRRKKEYADNNGIRLLPIWYWDFDNIEKILDKELKIDEKEIVNSSLACLIFGR